MTGEKIRLLVLEDNKDDAWLLKHVLGEAGLPTDFKIVETEADYRREIESFHPDLIVSDFTVPGFGGGEALKIAREKRPDTPFIYVSGSIGEERAIEALKSGAADYVLKDRLARFVPAIQRALREIRDREESRRLQAELLHAAKMASIGLLVGGLAHELNNPLTSILGRVEWLLLRNPPGSPLHGDLSVIARQTERCARLIKSLLAFVRKGERRLMPIDVNTLVLEVLALKTYDLCQANIEVIPDLAEDLPAVQADPDHIQQVLFNLLNNAEQAMGKAAGSVTVKTRLENGRVLVTVADTGPGIAPEHIHRVFEPFFTTKEPGQGTGLGLSISEKIIKALGGSMTVASTPGQGACFTVDLPAA